MNLCEIVWPFAVHIGMRSVILLLLLSQLGAALQLGRASVIRGAAAGFLAAHAPRPAFAAGAGAQLRDARTQLERAAALIDEGKWDGVRTAIKTAPLVKAKALVTAYIDELGTDTAQDLVVPREDLVQVPLRRN